MIELSTPMMPFLMSLRTLRRYLAIALLGLAGHSLSAQEPFPPPLPVDTAGMKGHPPADPATEDDDPFYWAGDGTAISGVYEVVIGVRDLDQALRYFGDLGFRLVQTGYLSPLAAQALYGHPSGVRSYRLQNGNIDSHGMIRLLHWEKPLGDGVGYGRPGTIGSRVMAMLTTDIYRLHDIYHDARMAGEPWLVSEPVRQSLTGDDSPRGFFERPVGTREMAVYGPQWNHLFFQRYGYTVPGYGNVHLNTRLRTSEITHHDFFVRVDSMAQLAYLEKVLGLQADGAPSLNGDWMPGPRSLYFLQPGESYWFQSFQSPNNVAGKLRFFVPVQPRADRSAPQRPGHTGVTAHTFYTPYLDRMWNDVVQAQLRPTPVAANEFGERCFVFRGPEGATWQIIERLKAPFNEPIFFYNIQMLDE